MIDDITEQIVVLRSHLDEWENIVRLAHGYFAAMDLTEGYREGRPNSKRSRMTNLTAQAYNRMQGYLEDDAISEDESLSPEQPV